MAENRFCETCDLNLDPLSYESHIAGKKHKRLVAIQYRRTREADRELIVSNFPPHSTQEQLASFFLQYGAIVKCGFVSQSEFCVTFRDVKPVQFLTQSNLFIQGRRLYFRKPNFKKNNKVPENQNNWKRNRNETSLNPETSSILARVSGTNKSFDQQVDDLILLLQDPQNVQQNKCDAVLRDLSNALRTCFSCELYKFGSTVTDLGLRNSDIDIYVKLLPHRPYDYEESMEYLKSTKRILSRCSNFDKVFGIFSAKTPIVKCEHVPTKLHCDINFKNSLGIRNSELIKFLQTLDARVKRLMLIVKWWAKHFDLTGSSKITNYALTMMVVYFLQQCKVLPTVEFLQKDCRSDTEWNCDFDTRIDGFAIENNQSLIDLFGGFLKFYSEFDYAKVISPLTGLSYPREVFAKVESIPKGYEKYRCKLQTNGGVGNTLNLKSSIVVIDPFELSHNVTPSTSERILEDFKRTCVKSCECFDKTKTDYKECEVLRRLFSMQIEKSRKNNKSSKDFEIHLKADTELSFKLQLAMKTDVIDVRKDWFRRTHDLVEKVFREILKCDLQMIATSPDRKQARTEDVKEVHDKNAIAECVKYRCRSFVSCLRDRKRYQIVNKDLSLYEKEKALTIKMMQDGNSAIPTKPLADFVLTIQDVIKPTTKLVLKLTNNLEAKGEFAAIGNYCRKHLKNMRTKPLITACTSPSKNKPTTSNCTSNDAKNKTDAQDNKASTSSGIKSQNGRTNEKPKSKQQQARKKIIRVRQDATAPGFIWF